MQTELEKLHVQQVYEIIASHFSETRYKPWPLIEKHIKSMQVGSLMADVGCGNGKYLGCNPDIFALGTDQSTNLISICKEKGHECFAADGLRVPFRHSFFDYVICIAVIHHFSTVENRIALLKELKRIVRIGGQVLVTAWAFEQEKKKYTEQDVMIKWHMQKKYDNAAKSNPKKGKAQTSEASTSEKPSSSNSTIALDTSDKKEGESPAKNEQQPNPSDPSQSPVLDRYYHLFKKGELDELTIQCGGYAIVQSVWDVDNWYVLLERTE